MTCTRVAAVLLCLCVSAALATTGFDLSYFQGDVSQSSFNCLKSDGYVFGIIEATAGTGGFNSHGAPPPPSPFSLSFSLKLALCASF